MSEGRVHGLLAALRRAVRQVNLYPVDHPQIQETLEEGAAQAEHVAAGTGEVILTLLEDALYLDHTLLGHSSLEFNGLMREMQTRGIESVTFIVPVLPADLGDLATFVAGLSDDVPAGSTVRLNERPLSLADLPSSELVGLRSSYAASLDVLRAIGIAVRGEIDFGMGAVADAVDSLLHQTLAQPGASLLLTTVKSHDEYTFFHSVNTCILSLAMGRLVGLSEERLKLLGTGALLHDIGKIGVPQAILRNPGRLQGADWETIKRHPQEGAQSILAASGVGQEVASAIAFEHHARFDGSGYPKLGHSDGHGHERSRHGRDLHLFSRLVSVSDTYDAITTRRSYRRAETPTRALNVLLNGAGTSYDPDLVRAFIQLMGVYPPGSLLQMDSGEVVLVVDHDTGAPESTRVLAVKDRAGGVIAHPEPVQFRPEGVVDQLLPDRVGVDPVSLLEVATEVERAA